MNRPAQQHFCHAADTVGIACNQLHVQVVKLVIFRNPGIQQLDQLSGDGFASEFTDHVPLWDRFFNGHGENSLDYEEGAASGSQLYSSGGNRFSDHFGQFIMLTQSQRLAVQIHNGGAHIVAAV